MFSELVDECVRLSRKLNLRDTHIIPYARFTLREAQTKEYFYRDRVEDQIVIPSTATEGSYVWDRPKRIRSIETVKYPESEGYNDAPDDIPRKPPKLIKPGDLYYYYGGPTYYVLNGVSPDTTVNISYFTYTRYFLYYENADERPAIYDREKETWSYPAGAGSDAEKEAARDLVWHWLLEDWNEMILQGILSKIYKDVSDDRAPATYAAYAQMLKVFQASEPKEDLQL